MNQLFRILLPLDSLKIKVSLHTTILKVLSFASLKFNFNPPVENIILNSLFLRDLYLCIIQIHRVTISGQGLNAALDWLLANVDHNVSEVTSNETKSQFGGDELSSTSSLVINSNNESKSQPVGESNSTSPSQYEATAQVVFNLFPFF